MRCDVQHARARELALAWKSELGGEPGQWRSFSQGVSVPDFETFFSPLQQFEFLEEEEKVYRADDCAAPLLVASVDVGQVMMNDSDDRCLVVYVRPPPRE